MKWTDTAASPSKFGNKVTEIPSDPFTNFYARSVSQGCLWAKDITNASSKGQDDGLKLPQFPVGYIAGVQEIEPPRSSTNVTGHSTNAIRHSWSNLELMDENRNTEIDSHCSGQLHVGTRTSCAFAGRKFDVEAMKFEFYEDKMEFENYDLVINMPLQDSIMTTENFPLFLDIVSNKVVSQDLQRL